MYKITILKQTKSNKLIKGFEYLCDDKYIVKVTTFDNETTVDFIPITSEFSPVAAIKKSKESYICEFVFSGPNCIKYVVQDEIYKVCDNIKYINDLCNYFKTNFDSFKNGIIPTE